MVADSQCLTCWIKEWFECDEEVGSATSSLSVMGHGRQILGTDDKARQLFRALASRRAHQMKMPNVACSCDSEAVPGDSLEETLLYAFDKILKSIEANKHPEPAMFEQACDDMAEFLATHQPEWFIIKDKSELREAAREMGFVAAERDT